MVENIQCQFADTDIEFNETWLTKHGLKHNPYGQAFVSYEENGLKEAEVWIVNGLWHRTDGPAVFRYNVDGSLRHYEFWFKGVCLPFKEWLMCVSDGLSDKQIDDLCKYDESVEKVTHHTSWGKTVSTREWHNPLTGLKHRSNGPAVIETVGDKLLSIHYWQFGQRHNVYGPSMSEATDNTSCNDYHHYFHLYDDEYRFDYWFAKVKHLHTTEHCEYLLKTFG